MSESLLKVNGERHAGWTSLSISRGMEQISGSFELSVTERRPNQVSARTIQEGSECQVLIDGETVITGYVDEVTPSYDATSHRVSVSGRDRTADLVDCSAIKSGGQWKDQTLEQIATELAKPFDVDVIKQTDTGAAFKSFAIQEGETAFEALERAARMRGVLLMATATGGLLITRASTEKISTVLEQGKNILSASGPRSFRDRYYKYVVKGENQGFDQSSPEQNSQTKAEATDPNIRKCRVLVILAEDCGDTAKLSQRALWESTVRLGRGCKATVTVQGWKHSDGLWQPNTLVAIRDKFLGLNQDMLVSSVNYRLDESGTLTELALSLPESFELVPVPEKDTGAW